MMRISALNEDTNSSSNEEHEPEVTREAQETIACSEYVRALSFKRKGNTEAALGLFLELLETQVLNDVTDKTKKLFSIKYNCFRNVAFILEERGENARALFYAKQAVRMDDTDIYTLNKAGNLALEFGESELAMVLFQRCQEFNPNHWPSADGLLRVLCFQRNFMDAYGWAMHWHRRDETYERSIKVLVELHERFSVNIPMFEDIFKSRFDYDRFKHIRPEPSCFSVPSFPEPPTPTVKYKDLNRFRVPELTWLSVGEWIINVYEECYGDPENLIRIHTWSDLLNATPTEDPAVENKVGTTGADEPTNAVPDKTEGESNSAEVDIATQKSSDESSDVKNAEDKNPKKRRGSDLSFLEQWGWHKTRYSRKKSSLPAEPAVELEDVTVGAFLKRVFSKYYQISFDAKESPFDGKEDQELKDQQAPTSSPIKPPQSIAGGGGECFKAPPPTEQETDFQKLTQTDFEKFLCEFEYFDVIPLLYKWLEYTSQYWRLSFPPQLAEQYVKIYIFYLTHYEFQQWAAMDCDEFKSTYAMALFYVEQVQELVQTKVHTKSQLMVTEDGEFQRVRSQLMFHSGFYCYNPPAEDFLVRICRYHWNNFLVARLDNDYELCLQSLEHIVMNLEAQPNQPPPAIKIPSKREDSVIELELIRGLIKALQRTISLNNVGRLYRDGNYKDLIPILKDSLRNNSAAVKGADNETMKIQTQFEILLECLWNVEDFEGCLVWAERCFKYCIDLYETFPEFSYRLKEWATPINFILTYFEALLNSHGVEVLMALGRHQSRLIQNIIRLVVHQLDAPENKNNNSQPAEVHAVNLKIPWLVLYTVRQRDEVSNCPLVGIDPAQQSNENSREEEEAEQDEDHIPKSFLLLFTAHEHLGRRLWCTKDGGELLKHTIKSVGPLVRTPLLEPYRDVINEYMEQVTYCLFAYPPKKARARHIMEHEATQVELNWENAVDLFDIYRPDTVPEFDAYKVDSISVDMEQLLQKILPLIPAHLDLSASTVAVKDFISGRVEKLPEAITPAAAAFPHRIASIYYLIADYHFKNRDFTKPTKFYVLDLALHPWRFDSWAGLALSKATKAETKINSCNTFGAQEFRVAEDAIRCFETCLKLRDKHTMLWIEYGTFTYMLHSYCSRSLKQASDTLSMDAFEVLETYKEKFLKIAYNCFHTVDLYLLEAPPATKQQAHHQKPSGETIETTPTETVEINNDESHDEKWLYHYMLGKVAEKKKDPPKVYLEHYLKSSKYLYECNATYPYKINHSNPQNLAIEALEIFYRITASIMKYLEQHETVTRDVGKLFERMLRELSTSPFTFNKAKLDNNSINALKRKMVQQQQQQQSQEQEPQKVVAMEVLSSTPPDTTTTAVTEEIEEKIEAVLIEKKKLKIQTEDGTGQTAQNPSPSRRTSQESLATSVTTTTTSRTTTGTSSTSSSSASSSSSSSDDEEGEETDDANATLTERELELIYAVCVKNFEECLGRFPEHYKSANRLVHHYLYAPVKLRNMTKARQLLLSTYVTTMGTKVQGLFADRKGNNFFNGIWRIPSSEIDRPGSFAAHLSKAVILLLEVLKAESEYEITFDLAVQLHKSPDPDKKYIKDSECKELLQQALSCCGQSFRNILRRQTSGEKRRSDEELINLLLEVNKMYRKCLKQMPGKEATFTVVLGEVYKVFVEDKVRKLPENMNLQELATKLCNQEINRRKSAEKGQVQLATNIPVHLPGIPMTLLVGSGVQVKPFDSLGIPNLPRSTTISMAPQQQQQQQMQSDGSMMMINPAAVVPNKTASAGKSNGGAVKPRGRPAGSNKNPVATGSGAGGAAGSANAAFMKQMMGNMDPKMLANMSALMSMYSTPQVQNDPEAMNKMIIEYYKMILGSSGAMGMSQLNANTVGSSKGTLPLPKQSAPSSTPKSAKPSTATASGQSKSGGGQYQQSATLTSQTTSQGGAAKSIPKYDMKSLIQSVASNILSDPSSASSAGNKKSQAQNTISLGGGQLTITPTQAPPMMPPMGKATKAGGVEDNAQMKKQYLPDLPKSLTITAASSGGGSGRPSGGNKSTAAKQHQQPAVTMSKVATNRESPVVVSGSSALTQQQQQMGKYSAAAAASSAAAVNHHQMMMQLMPGTQEYELYVKTMAAYSDMVRGRGPVSHQQHQQQQQQQAKSKPTAGQGKKKAQVGGQQQQQQQALQQNLGKASNKGATSYPISTMPRFPNMAFQQEHQAMGGSGMASSPPKTLQQKLAERQKAISISLLESNKSVPQQAMQMNIVGQPQRSGGMAQVGVASGSGIPIKRKTNTDPTGDGQAKKKKAPKVDVIVLD